MKLKNKTIIKKMIKKITIKKIRIKLNTKIKWNQMLRDEIEKWINFKMHLKAKQMAIKGMKIKIDTWF